MTSNVVALPGIGIAPPTPVRAPTGVTKPEAEDRGGRRGFLAGDTAKQPPADKNGQASRPTSPVDLNSLLAAQKSSAEQGGEPAAQLSEAEQKQVDRLKKNDAEIHRHEQAHAAAGGQYTGAPQFGYTDGPDGRRYATSGHVSIDVTPVAGDPKATIAKMDVVRRAANAPAEPSGADRAVAGKAAAAKQQAQIELAQLKADELAGTKDEEVAATPGGGIAKSDDEDRTKQAAPAAAISHAAAAAAYAAPLNAIAGA